MIRRGRSPNAGRAIAAVRGAAALLVVAVAACATSAPSAPSTSALAPSTPANTTTITPASAGASAAVASPQGSLGRIAAWRADLATLVPGMAAIHPALTHSASRAELDAAVAAVSATAESATDDQLMVGVL